MKVLTSFGVSVTFALLLGTVGPGAAGCDPIGNVRFVCDQLAPEDLAPVPGSEWVLSSGMAANGAIRLINLRDRATTALFPTAIPRERLDRKTYDSCPGPIDPAEKEKFRAHGLYLAAGRSSVHTLYVVHHGNRESIEVFELDARPKPPTLTWIGCAVAPDPIGSARMAWRSRRTAGGCISADGAASQSFACHEGRRRSRRTPLESGFALTTCGGRPMARFSPPAREEPPLRRRRTW